MNFPTGNRPRKLTAVAIALAMSLSLGCSPMSSVTSRLPGPLGKSSKDEKLRKAVEADDFPNAQQVGL